MDVYLWLTRCFKYVFLASIYLQRKTIVVRIKRHIFVSREIYDGVNKFKIIFIRINGFPSPFNYVNYNSVEKKIGMFTLFFWRFLEYS